MQRKYDVAIVGMGIVGLAHALAAARAGLSVCVVDREQAQIGASVRNFGFVTVTGQRAGEFWRLARRARDIWSAVAAQADIPVLQTGLTMVARRPEAAAVLEAFLATDMGEGCVLRSRSAFLAATQHPALGDCRAVLTSPHELRVEAREALPRLAHWLEEANGVLFRRGVAVRAVEPGRLVTAAGAVEAELIFVCPGDDLATLFPEVMAAHGVTRCRLQMLRLADPGYRLPAPLMSDLGLVRYLGYAELPQAEALRAVLLREQAEHLDNGIHLIAVQSADGSLVVGDSHHYAPSPAPFAYEQIDRLMLEEFALTTGRPAPPVVERWIGAYASSSAQDWFCHSVAPGVRMVVVTCGAGMSTAFAIAEQTLSQALGRTVSSLT